MTALLDRRLLFVTGKGGVGKTSIAIGLALLAASEGKKVLLCEVDAKGDLAAGFEVGRLGYKPTEVAPGLHAMVMNTEESLKEYLKVQLHIPLLGRIGPLARSFDFVANAAPGVKEILVVGKLAFEARERNYDLVVIDSPASGHVVGQLSAPGAIRDLVRIGMVRDQTDWMVEMLSDPAITGTAIVATPEEMPVTETLELADRLRAETDVELAAVIVNRVLPELFGSAEEAVFGKLRKPKNEELLRAEAGTATSVVMDGAELAVRLRRSRSEHMIRLREGLASSVPLLYVPELFSRDQGIRASRRMAEALGEELL